LSGPLTGNVTGNCSGSAATVTGASQSAITSVGTLTGLKILDYIEHYNNTNTKIGFSDDNTFKVIVNGNNVLYITGTTAATHKLHVNDTCRFTNTATFEGNITASKIGIGAHNSDSSYKLDVWGNARFMNATYFENSVYFQTSNIYMNSYLVHNGNTDTKIGFPTNDNIYFYCAGSVQMRINNNGVGIHTDAPSNSSHRLEVGGNAYFSGHLRIGTTDNITQLTVKGSDNGGISILRSTDKYHWRIFNSDTNTLTFQGRNDDSTMSIKSNCDDLLCLHDSGSVGIGTSDPGEKLEVSGTVKSSCFKSEYGGTWAQLQITGGSDGAMTITNSTDKTTQIFTAFGDGTFRIRPHSGSNASICDTGGNVGIGAGSPSHRLEVGGYTHPDTPTMKVYGDALFGNDHAAIKLRFNGSYVKRTDHRRWAVNLGASDTGSGLNAKAKKTIMAGKLYFNTNSETSTSYLETGNSSTGYDGGSGSWWGDFNQYMVRPVVDTGSYGIILSQYDSESDRRIKHNIIDQSGALQKVLDIELKQYKYNNLGLSDNLVYGFIAQQVKEVYEPAIDYGDGVIHDINKYFDFDYDNSSNIIKLFMDDRDNSYNEIELIVETKIVEKDNSGNDYDNYTSTKKTYTIKNKTENYIEIDYTNKEKYPDRIFATGHYIRDFHYIQKQRIFTLHHGAIQDIYKEQQADKAEIAELKNELKEMKTMLNALKSHLGL
jgi:hypothetical protein